MGKSYKYWIQLVTARLGTDISAQKFFDEAFFHYPHFTGAEFIIPIFHEDYQAMRGFLIDLASIGDGYNLEFHIMVNMRMAINSQWEVLAEFIDALKGHRSIYSIGVDAEHCRLEDKPYDYANWNDANYDRFRALVVAAGKPIINFYQGNFTNNMKKDPHIHHVNWCHSGHRRTLYRSSEFAGSRSMAISMSTYTERDYPCKKEPNPSETYVELSPVGWNSTSISMGLAIAYEHDDEVRRSVIFSQIGLWKNIAFKQDVLDLVQGYDYITLTELEPDGNGDGDGDGDGDGEEIEESTREAVSALIEGSSALLDKALELLRLDA